jgi:hypothetical protein
MNSASTATGCNKTSLCVELSQIVKFWKAFTFYPLRAMMDIYTQEKGVAIANSIADSFKTGVGN